MIVLAGVTGHVGQVAANALLAAGKPVKVIVRNKDKAEAWSKKGAEVAIGDLNDTAFLTTALKGATAFYTLLPASFAWTDVFSEQKKLGDGIAAAVKASGVPHVVVLSSQGADLDAGTGPIKGLHHLENALRATQAKVTAVRAGYFQENVGNAIGAARDKGIFPSFAPANAPMAMIATVDIGLVVADALQRTPAKHEIVDVIGPAATATEVAKLLGETIGKNLQVIEIPPAGHVDAYVGAGLPKTWALAYAEMNGAFGTGKIIPKGDRRVDGKTPVSATIRALAGN